MKVLLINGSPNEFGCTNQALEIIKEELKNNGVDSEIFYLGKQAINGCVACGYCRKSKTYRCSISDIVNEAKEKAADCQGIIIGSPVHYASPAGNLLSFLDRFFYSGDIKAKFGASIVSARRAGTTASIDVLNKYFSINNMHIVGSSYWNMVHGSNKDEVLMDLEGIQTMRNLAKNMAYLIKAVDIAKANGLEDIEYEKGNRTNFIKKY